MTGHYRRVARTFLVSIAIAMAAPVAASSKPFESFEGSITRAGLEHYLSRAVTMEGLLHEHGSLENSVRFLRRVGARFAGRTLYLWGGERNLEVLLDKARFREGRLHRAMPELMLQAAIFEIVTEDVNELTLPASIARQFGEGEVER